MARLVERAALVEQQRVQQGRLDEHMRQARASSQVQHRKRRQAAQRRHRQLRQIGCLAQHLAHICSYIDISYTICTHGHHHQLHQLGVLPSTWHIHYSVITSFFVCTHGRHHQLRQVVCLAKHLALKCFSCGALAGSVRIVVLCAEPSRAPIMSWKHRGARSAAR